METFYRVQDDAGIGPYQNSDFAYSMGWSHSDNRHPAPFRSSYYMNKAELCGFRTMQDLYAWFGGWLPILLKNGYRVVKATGTVRYEDSHQVVFKPS